MTQEKSAVTQHQFGYGVVATSEIFAIAEALAEAQGMMDAAIQDGTAKASTSQSGKTFAGYKYATLASVWDACRQPLKENGLSVLQPAITDGELVGCMTFLWHTSGQWIKSHLLLPLEVSQQGVQAFGSVLSYARRYSLAALLGIAVEDDDGQAAVQVATRTPSAPRKARKRSKAPAAPESPPTAQAAPTDEAATEQQWAELLELHPEYQSRSQLMFVEFGNTNGKPNRHPSTLTRAEAEKYIAEAKEAEAAPEAGQ